MCPFLKWKILNNVEFNVFIYLFLQHTFTHYNKFNVLLYPTQDFAFYFHYVFILETFHGKV